MNRKKGAPKASPELQRGDHRGSPNPGGRDSHGPSLMAYGTHRIACPPCSAIAVRGLPLRRGAMGTTS